MKIAHFSPLPPHRSGVADYCADLIPHLGCLAALDAYSSAGPDVGSELPFGVHSIARFLGSSSVRFQYDICLYHMGNHPAYHNEIYSVMTRYPGITVLHDVDLYAFFLQRAARHHGRAAFVREMGYAYGPVGTAEAYQAFNEDLGVSRQHRPLFNRVVDTSLGLIVHTGFARQRLLSERPDAQVIQIPLAATVDEESPRPEPPTLLGQLPPEAIVIGSFGYIDASKRIETVLYALAELRGTVPEFHYLLIGQPVQEYSPLPLIGRLNLEDIVHLPGFVDEAQFQAYIHWVDISVNLRSGPTSGEMSGTLVRILAHGRPTLVSDVGGFATLPDEAVLKIGQDEDEVEQVVTALRRLITDSDLRAAYGEAARRFIEEEHSFAAVARQYVDFADEVLSSLTA